MAKGWLKPFFVDLEKRLERLCQRPVEDGFFRVAAAVDPARSWRRVLHASERRNKLANSSFWLFTIRIALFPSVVKGLPAGGSGVLRLRANSGRRSSIDRVVIGAPTTALGGVTSRYAILVDSQLQGFGAPPTILRGVLLDEVSIAGLSDPFIAG